MQISRRLLAIALALAACAPTVDGPAERQRALDREDGDRLAVQLSALPGVLRAEAVIRRPARDPFARGPAASGTASATASPAASATVSPTASPTASPTVSATASAAAPTTASVVITVDDLADRAALAAAARTLAAALAPGAAPAIVVEVGAIRPRLAKVGPFTVEAGSRAPLRAALAAALALIAALAGWIGRAALRQRRGISAQ